MFPAYKLNSGDSSTVEPEISTEFLHNPSYDTIPVSSTSISVQISSSSDSSSDGKIQETKRFKAICNRPPSPLVVEDFYEDRERKKEYLKLDFLPNRAVPFYKVSSNFKRFTQGKKTTFRRYFKVKRIKKLMATPVRALDEKSEKDEELRIYLIKNSQEVDKWIEYINFKVRIVAIKEFD